MTAPELNPSDVWLRACAANSSRLRRALTNLQEATDRAAHAIRRAGCDSSVTAHCIEELADVLDELDPRPLHDEMED